MDIIAVDDERLPLEGLVQTINKVCNGNKVTGFNNPFEALEHIKNHKTDVAFLDIEMFGMNGIELAKKCKENNPNLNIIFVTGYSEYAIDAFNVRASGYLLKPATEEAVKNELENLRIPYKCKKRIYIQTFGNFELFVDNKPVLFSRGQAKELLAFLVDRKGSGASTSEIASVLWEDKEYTRSIKNQIQHIIAYLMQTLKEVNAQDIIIRSWNNIAVDKNKFDCDYYDFLNGNTKAINAFTGEYMNNYTWAEFTTGYLENKANTNK